MYSRNMRQANGQGCRGNGEVRQITGQANPLEATIPLSGLPAPISGRVQDPSCAPAFIQYTVTALDHLTGLVWSPEDLRQARLGSSDVQLVGAQVAEATEHTWRPQSMWRQWGAVV